MQHGKILGPFTRMLQSNGAAPIRMPRDCGFLDIDHDRDVDADDYALFATAMTGLQQPIP